MFHNVWKMLLQIVVTSNSIHNAAYLNQAPNLTVFLTTKFCQSLTINNKCHNRIESEVELFTWEKRNLSAKLRQCITPSIVAHVIRTLSGKCETKLTHHLLSHFDCLCIDSISSTWLNIIRNFCGITPSIGRLFTCCFLDSTCSKSKHSSYKSF